MASSKNDSKYLQEFIDDYYERFLKIVSTNRNKDYKETSAYFNRDNRLVCW